jgi:hypothetical protein
MFMTNKDFEVMPIGSITEIKLSRKVAHAIEDAMKDPNSTLPDYLVNEYMELKSHYNMCIEAEGYM